MNFKNKVVIITGAGAGIGYATALKFAEAEAKVIVNSKSTSANDLIPLMTEKGTDCMFVQGDVSKWEDCQNIVERTIEKYGKVDILVNNAGIVIGGTIITQTLEDWDLTMNTNIKSMFMMSKLVVPVMQKQGGGVIVNTSSICGVKGVKDRLAYSASKGAVVALTKAMALDHAKENIRVNCVCPGTILTPSLQQRINNAPDPKVQEETFHARQPIGRLGTPEEIAQAIMFASCDEAAFMTGAMINIDGGYTM